MRTHYRTFFGLRRETFAPCLAIQEILPTPPLLAAALDIEEILQTPALLAVADRFTYTIGLGAIALVTGEVGSGKSTALRWAASRLHPSEYRPLWITAFSGSLLEVY